MHKIFFIFLISVICLPTSRSFAEETCKDSLYELNHWDFVADLEESLQMYYDIGEFVRTASPRQSLVPARFIAYKWHGELHFIFWSGWSSRSHMRAHETLTKLAVGNLEFVFAGVVEFERSATPEVFKNIFVTDRNPSFVEISRSDASYLPELIRRIRRGGTEFTESAQVTLNWTGINDHKTTFQPLSSF